MALDLNFIKEFLILLKKSSDDGFSYSIPFDSKDKNLMHHIGVLDLGNLVEHEKIRSNARFKGRVRITQRGLDLLKTIVK